MNKSEGLPMKEFINDQENNKQGETSCLHDLIITWEGVTPDEFKKAGKGLHIEYGHTLSPFGYCFLATTPRGICKLAFFDTAIEETLITNEFFADWPNATRARNDKKIAALATCIFKTQKYEEKPLKLLLKGTPFQLKVWEALLSIPGNSLITYQQMAKAIQNPKATRAVASAIAKNNIAYLIPCHRVIRKNGDFGQYRWGLHRKQALLAWESSQT